VLHPFAARCDALTVDALRREALRLDDDARAKLAHDLLDSLDDLSKSEIEQLWPQEAVRRHDAIVAGEVETIPGDEVVAQARAKRG
jgi:putative addiction module component (TIGR02574 family)